MNLDRLFVPLASEPYEWFASGAKQWELRRNRPAFSTKQVYVGRRVELRRGYSTTDSIWGVIAEVVEAEGLVALFDRVPYHLVIPYANDLENAIDVASGILGICANDSTSLIAFRVLLD